MQTVWLYFDLICNRAATQTQSRAANWYDGNRKRQHRDIIQRMNATLWMHINWKWYLLKSFVFFLFFYFGVRTFDAHAQPIDREVNEKFN